MDKKKKRNSQSKKIFIGLILGIVVGILLHTLVPDSHFKNDILIDGIFLYYRSTFL